MKSKLIKGLLLILFLASMLALAFNIQPIKASGTIYIKADGSVEPTTANITSADSVTYYFTGNNYDEIVVERSNIIIDGSGYALQGPSPGVGIPRVGTGFNLTSINSVTIKNTNIKGFHWSVYLYNSSNNKISGNEVTLGGEVMLMGDFCIYLVRSSNNIISGNRLIVNGVGVCLEVSSNNTVSGNDVIGNKNGIRLEGSSNNSISGNSIGSNFEGIKLLEGSSNNSIFGNNITKNYKGIGLDNYSNNNTIRENNITKNYMGIWLEASSNNMISGNNIICNVKYKGVGIVLQYSSNNNTIYHNNFINGKQVDSEDSVNTWDNGTEGNYWSDYTGEDHNGDGIGDTPYVIDENNQDNYPLMNPWGEIPEEEVPPPVEEEVPFWMQWWFWTIVIAVVVALSGAVYFLMKRKPPTPITPTIPTEGTL